MSAVLLNNVLIMESFLFFVFFFSFLGEGEEVLFL